MIPAFAILPPRMFRPWPQNLPRLNTACGRYHASLWQPPYRRAHLRRQIRPSPTGSLVIDVSVSDDIAVWPVAGATAPGLREDAAALLAAAVSDGDAELSVLLCTDDFIADLNSKWRNIAKPTDVLSFPQGDNDVVLGDIVISVETALRQAEDRGHSLSSEIRILLVHGLLHLLGYDHETSEDDLVEMSSAEHVLMTRMGWEGSGLISAAGGATPH